MTIIKFKTIVEIAKEIKEYVEKEYELPKTVTVGKIKYDYPTCAYLLANGVVNQRKDVELLQMSEAPSPTGEDVNFSMNTNEYKSLAKNLITFMKPKNVRRLPNYLTGKNKKIKQRIFIYCFAKIIVFYNKEGRLPTSCSFPTIKKVSTTKKTTSTKKSNNCTNPYTSKPHYTEQGVGKLGQITNHHCGPNMLHQMLKKFGITKYSQSDIAKLAGTTSSGTDPSGLRTALEYIARKEGIKLKVEQKYLSDFGTSTVAQFTAIGKLMCKSNIAVGTHIGYEDGGEKRGNKVFGHYEGFDKIDIKNKQIRVLNSLGSKCSSTGYCGHLQWRSFDLEKAYINNKTGVKSIWVVTKQ